MDFKKFELLLKKINTLKQNIDISAEEISELEIDLLKNYIRQLYESVALTGEVAEKNKVSKSTVTGNKHSAESTEQTGNKEAEKPVIVPDQKRDVVPVAETGKEVVEHVLYQSSLPVEEKIIRNNVMDSKTVVDEKIIEAKSSDSEILDLFSLDSSSDIADKLSSAPLTDINKGFSINDKILTVNDLFGGKDDLFRETLDFVNNAARFEEAKEWIIRHVAIREHWTRPDKKGKARHFVKLVRRRLPV